MDELLRRTRRTVTPTQDADKDGIFTTSDNRGQTGSTMQSRAPELNLFGLPRVTAWPVRSENTTADKVILGRVPIATPMAIRTKMDCQRRGMEDEIRTDSLALKQLLQTNSSVIPIIRPPPAWRRPFEWTVSTLAEARSSAPCPNSMSKRSRTRRANRVRSEGEKGRAHTSAGATGLLVQQAHRTQIQGGRRTGEAIAQRGQGFLCDTGRLALAKKRSEQVLKLDPHNGTARNFEEKVRPRDG